MPVTTIHARIAASAQRGQINSSILFRSTGAADQGAALTGTVTPHITNYVVTDGADTDGSASDVTLRYAIGQALTFQEYATITFSPSMINLIGNTITLSTAQVGAASKYAPTAFVIDNADIVIDGSAHPGLSIDGGDLLRPFVVTASASLRLEDLTLSGGLATTAAAGNAISGAGGVEEQAPAWEEACMLTAAHSRRKG